MSRVLSLAGFQVTLIGRFWVTPEVPRIIGSVSYWRELIIRAKWCAIMVGSTSVFRL